MIISAYKGTPSINLLIQAKNEFAQQGYIFDWKTMPLKDDLIEDVTNSVYTNYPNDMPYQYQTLFMKRDLENKLNPKKQLVRSLQKNMVLLQIAYENQTVDYNYILEEYKEGCKYDTVGLEELATTSFALFEALFSYGNDKFLENSNEYTFLPSDGLDYSTLDLSPINVLYINKDNGFKNSLQIELTSKKKRITEIDAKISKNEQSLAQVIKSGNEKAKVILQSNLQKTYQERCIIGVIQKSAKQFIKDMLEIFGEEYKKLYYQDYYISLPFMSYINSSKIIDMQIFNSIGFEDTIRNKEVKPITEDWLVERKNKNQRNMSSLINTGKIKVNNNSYLDYNNVVDLEKHNKLARLIFYMLYDRPTFKRRIREILKKGR